MAVSIAAWAPPARHHTIEIRIAAGDEDTLGECCSPAALSSPPAYRWPGSRPAFEPRSGAASTLTANLGATATADANQLAGLVWAACHPWHCVLPRLTAA